eukprot:Gb_34025 [translate_table: standard]
MPTTNKSHFIRFELLKSIEIKRAGSSTTKYVGDAFRKNCQNVEEMVTVVALLTAFLAFTLIIDVCEALGKNKEAMNLPSVKMFLFFNCTALFMSIGVVVVQLISETTDWSNKISLCLKFIRLAWGFLFAGILSLFLYYFSLL